MPIKPTALASPKILERLTEGERAVRAARGEAARRTTAHSASAAAVVAAEGEGCEPPSLEEASAAAQLSPEESRQLEEGMAGLRALCDGARALAALVRARSRISLTLTLTTNSSPNPNLTLSRRACGVAAAAARRRTDPPPTGHQHARTHAVATVQPRLQHTSRIGPATTRT